MKTTVVPTGIPVIIIKSALQTMPKAEEQVAWSRALDQMAASIGGAELIVAEQSNHMIPYIQPDLVIETVMKVVDLAKDARPSSAEPAAGGSSAP